MDKNRLEEEVGRLFFEKMEFVLSQPGVLLRILNACGSNSDIMVRKREEWGIYLDGLVEHVVCGGWVGCLLWWLVLGRMRLRWMILCRILL